MKLQLGAPTMVTPYKIGAVATFTREMTESSNIEALVANTLSRACGLKLDATLFDANAATAARPPGLRNGISALTASTATDPTTAMTADLAALAASLAAVADNGGVAFIVSAGRAAVIRTRSYASPGLVFTSSQVAANLVIAVALNALASAGGSDPPQIESNRDTLLYEDDAPGPDDGTLKAPTRSLFQTDAVALKIRLPISWALRDPRGVAWLTASGW